MTATLIVAPPTTVEETLHAAADRIERLGWMRTDNYGGSYYSEGLDAECLFMAILGAGDNGWHEAVAAMVHHLGVTTIAEGMAWNNAAERTKRQVVAALRACAVTQATSAA